MSFHRPGKFWKWLCIAAALAVMPLGMGCTRRYYRLSADRESIRLINQKSTNPRWAMWNLNVYSDPRSRFYMPGNPDRPVMPPDDPDAHAYMLWVYKMRGPWKWRHTPEADWVVNPGWETLLPTYVDFTPEGKLKLDMPTCMRIARIHDVGYQTNLEEVYLSALDVAFERFRFDVQYFLTNDTSIFVQGDEPPAILGATGPGFPNSQTIVNTTTRAIAKRHLAAGGDIIAQAANSMVWNFAGPDTSFATSLLSTTITQPFLRNGGKVIALEALTRVERNLLSNMRAEALFLQQFYRDLAVGGGTDASPQRIGGFQGGAGLSGFTGIGVGGFGGVGADLNFGQAGGVGRVGASGAGAGIGLAAGGEATVGGFYGLVQRIQAIRNTETSLAAQLNSLGLLEANFSAGLIELVQVDEFRQNIESERSTLLRSQVSLQDTLEQFMIQTLGLPAWMPVEIDDSIIRPFQFVDPGLTRIQNRLLELQANAGRMPKAPPLAGVQELGDQLMSILAEIPRHIGILEGELAELRAQKDKVPNEGNDDERKQYMQGLDSIGRTIDGLQDRIEELRGLAVKALTGLRPGGEARTLDEIVGVIRAASSNTQEVGLVQAGIRVDKVIVDPVHVTPEEAFWVARNNRLDWMNRRTALTDQWRLIAFNANRLMATFDVVIDADMGTVGNNPANIRAPTGNMTARVQFDAPITRKSERNLYRQSLIDYQRARRGYIQYVDTVNLALRSQLRQLDRLHKNLEIQRRALAISIRRVDQTLEDLNRPFAPTQPGQAPAQLGPTLSQNLLRALSDFRNTQDNFMSVWMNYEASRMNFLIVLGVMRLDENGNWIDEPIDVAVTRALAECPKAPDRPDRLEAYLDRLDRNGAFASTLPQEPARKRIDPLSAAFALDEAVDEWVVQAELADNPDLGGMSLDQLSSVYQSEPDGVPQPHQSMRPSIVEKMQSAAERMRAWVLRSPKEFQEPTKVTRQEFMDKFRTVGELTSQGKSIADIAEQSGLEPVEVEALQVAYKRVQPDAVKKEPLTIIRRQDVEKGTENAPGAEAPVQQATHLEPSGPALK